jgi:predicted RNase H-like nuclease
LPPDEYTSNRVRRAAAIVLDAPIGLPDLTAQSCALRPCDRSAKHWIGKPLQSSVFQVGSQAELVEWRRRRDANEAQRQGHFRGLLPAIHAAEDIASANRMTLESHPELAFAALAGRQLPACAAKKSLIGALVRLALLAEKAHLHCRLEDFPLVAGVTTDNFIDALAMATIARDWARDGQIAALGDGIAPIILRKPRPHVMALPAGATSPAPNGVIDATELTAIAKAWTARQV